MQLLKLVYLEYKWHCEWTILVYSTCLHSISTRLKWLKWHGNANIELHQRNNNTSVSERKRGREKNRNKMRKSKQDEKKNVSIEMKFILMPSI